MSLQGQGAPWKHARARRKPKDGSRESGVGRARRGRREHELTPREREAHGRAERKRGHAFADSKVITYLKLSLELDTQHTHTPHKIDSHSQPTPNINKVHRPSTKARFPSNASHSWRTTGTCRGRISSTQSGNRQPAAARCYPRNAITWTGSWLAPGKENRYRGPPCQRQSLRNPAQSLRSPAQNLRSPVQSQLEPAQNRRRPVQSLRRPARTRCRLG